jgi:predicted dehydrogenase
MKPLGIALIGYGSIGRVHMMGYKTIPHHYGLPANSLKIVGVATSRPETAQQAAQEIGCDLWTADYRDLLALPEVDLIDCCTPNHKHAEVVLAAAAAGKHIYCEKPLGLNLAEARRMVAATQKAGLTTQMTFNFRFFPAILRARQLINEGFLGRVYSFRGRYYRASYIDPAKPLSWKLRQETSGLGGALFDLGSHVLDLIYYLLGDFDAVQATLETAIKERPLAAGSIETGPVDVDDLAFLQVRLAGGGLGVVEASRLATGASNDLEIEIFGEKGALRFNVTDPAWLWIYDTRDAGWPVGGKRGFRKVETMQQYAGQKAPDWTAIPSFTRSHTECQYQFLRALWDNRPATPSLTDGLRIQEVLEAAVQSAQEQRWVKIAEVR